LGSIDHPSVLARRIADQVRALLDGYGAAVYRLEEASGNLVAVATSGDLGPAFRPGLVFPPGTGIVGLVLRSAGAVTTPNVLSDSRVTLTPDNEALIEQARFRSVLAVPLLVDGTVIGAVSVGAAEGRIFTDRELTVVQAFADQAAIAIDNARLYREAEEHRRRLATMVEVARKLTSRLDFPSVLATVAEAVSEVFGAEVGFRLIEGDDLVLHGATRGARERTVRERLKIGESISGKVAATGTPIVTSNVAADMRAIPEHRRGGRATDALMCVPIRGGSHILGTLNIYRERGQQFGDGDLAIAMSLADQAGVALENASLYRRSVQQAERTAALADVARLLSETLDVEVVGRRIADSTRELLSVHHAVIFRLEVESGSLVALTATEELAGALGRNIRFPRGIGAVGRAVEERTVVASPNALTDGRIVMTPELRRNIEQAPWRAVLAVPLLIGDRVIGAIGIGDREGRVFEADEIRLAEAFAAQAALALENAKLYGEARRAYEDLSRAQEELLRAETLRAVGQLAAGAAHHLNNLLSVVLGRLHLGLMKCEDPYLRAQLETAERAAGDGADVVRRLLRFSRRQTEPECVSIELNELAAEVIELTRPRWQNECLAQGITVDVRLERGDIPTIAGDPTSLREVLLNLIFNAVDAMPAGGRITITTWAAEGDACCQVSDTGIGMPPDVQRRALEPFFTTKGLKSTGLGLSAAYGIVQRHGGTISIESEPDHGAVVTLRLPSGAPISEP
jgi:GAF domain-containing protein